jgi:hypothetical protein
MPEQERCSGKEIRRTFLFVMVPINDREYDIFLIPGHGLGVTIEWNTGAE